MASWGEQRAYERAMKQRRKEGGAKYMEALRAGRVKQDSVQMFAPLLIWIAIVGGFLFLMGAFVAGSR